MDFVSGNIELDGGITNPALALANAVAALVFAVWMVSVLRSQRPLSQKSLRLTGVFALAFLGARLAELLARLVLVSMHSAPGLEVGFLGHPPLFLAPLAAVFLALAFQGLSGLWRRARLYSQPASGD
jgi:hypothetical protein